MKSKILFVLLGLAVSLSGWADRKGVYAFFHHPNVLVEDENIQMALVIDSINNTACLMVRNKTARVLYLDKAHSFSYLNRDPKCLFSNSARKETTTKGRGASVNLGAVAGAVGIGGAVGSLLNGVNLGGSRGVEDATIHYEQRILALAPQAAYIIENWGDIRSHVNKALPKKRKKGMYWEYDETSSPLALRGVVNYDVNESCDHPIQLTAENYVDRIVLDALQGVRPRNLGLTAYCRDAVGRPYVCFVTGVPKGMWIFCGCMPVVGWCMMPVLPKWGREMGFTKSDYKADKTKPSETPGVVSGTYRSAGQ